jgi:hypothetical protein
MTSFFHSVKPQEYSFQLLCLSMMVILCVVSCVSSTADPSLAAVTQALKDENKDPAATDQVLRDNLGKVEDKRVIPMLLDYLKGTKHRETVYTSNLGRVVFYLERVTGIKSHIEMTIAGPIYLSGEDFEKDVNQWQNWWNANKDYIYWDEQARALQVKPH